MSEESIVSGGSIVAELRNQIAELHRTSVAIATRQENVVAVLVALLAQHCDPTHVDVRRAAQLRGCSAKTIRRAIAAGELTLEVVPGTRESGIPIEQIYSRWIPIRVARATLRKMRAEHGTDSKARGDRVRAIQRRGCR